ncbi:MAG: pantoate--beta-alanine ligase [Dehalococcoidia bacterium]
MRVLRTGSDFRSWRQSIAGSLGLVPTMGYLHDGHLSLVRAARRANDIVAASIFVNPAQFGPDEDLARYPRDEASDLALLDREGVDAVFAPSADEMYPQGFATYVNVEGLTARLEGASRPTHFRGVTTVVLKLLEIVQPQRAYFGQKDAQQLAVVRRMVGDLNVPVEIVGMPIVREPDGLAMSSRNAYLSLDERQAALVISRSVTLAQRTYAHGERDAETIRARMRDLIGAEPLASVDYVSIAHPDTLDELTRIEGRALVSLAVRIGATRLIDNTLVGGDSTGA